MSPTAHVRLGRIGYINCYPVYGAIDRGIVEGPADLVTGTPSELNDLLAAGELDVSVISAVEYARDSGAYHLLPDLAISSDGPVQSVVRPAARGGAGRPGDPAIGLLTYVGVLAPAPVSGPLARTAAIRGGPS